VFSRDALLTLRSRQGVYLDFCSFSSYFLYPQVRPRLVATLTRRTTLAQCTAAGRVQARPHGVQLSAQPVTPVPRRPLPVCLQCRLQTTSSLCQPRSSRRASPSSQQLWSAGFFCGRPRHMELVTRQSERSGHQQRLLQAFTEDVFIFSLLVYIAH